MPPNDASFVRHSIAKTDPIQLWRPLWSHYRSVSNTTLIPLAPEGLKRFSRYILDQNAAIANGTSNATTINLKFLGIGDGITVSLHSFRQT